jgi:plasmid stabilization system protein ParE
MAKTLKWTEAAWTDLDAVVKYITRDSRHYAAAFVREVRDAARSLRFFPERGSVVPEFDDVNIREIFVRSYRLIYKIMKKRVIVIAFVHGARDLAALWKRERRTANDEND